MNLYLYVAIEIYRYVSIGKYIVGYHYFHITKLDC